MSEIPIFDDPAGSILPVLVVPGASRTGIVGPHGAAIRLRVSAAPEKGRANLEAEKLLAAFFGTKVELVGGATSRRKRFLLEGLDPDTVTRRIREEWG